MANETVAAAFGITNILGQGLVWIPLLGGMQVLAYHAPQFHSHILAVCYLSKHCDVMFSERFRGYAGCFLLKPGAEEVVFKAPCIDGRYALELGRHSRKNTMSVGTAVAQSPRALEWHSKTGYPSAQRYMQLSRILNSVPYFHPNLTEELDCIPCLTGKSRKAPVRALMPAVTQPIQEIHLDISGPFRSDMER